MNVGQLQSILLTSDNHLISGYRRYYAIQSLLKTQQHNGLVKCIKIDNTYKEIGLELFDKLQFTENEQRKDIDNFQRAKIFSEYKLKGYSQDKISEIFEKNKSLVSQVITINEIEPSLKELLKQIQYFGMTKKKFNALNLSLESRQPHHLGISQLYKIAIEKGLKAQSKTFLVYFRSKLSDSELLDFGVKPIQDKPIIKVSEFKKINEVFVSKLDSLVKKFPDKVKYKRLDFLYKTAYGLFSSNDLVVREDLKLTNLIKKPKPKLSEDGKTYLPNNASSKAGMNKSFSDASFGRFFSILDEVAIKLGKMVIKVNPSYTSQDCSDCGNRIKKSLSTRTHVCNECGLVLNRDHNASLNILRLGLQSLGINS